MKPLPPTAALTARSAIPDEPGPGPGPVQRSAAAGGPPRSLSRIWGWDILRGLCALAVATYHLMEWQGLGALHSFGSYGVYLFFVLSGASLTYNYSGTLRGLDAMVRFLSTRWLRLAPLYAVVSGVFVVLYSAHHGALVEQLPLRLLLNLSFAFGVRDPVVWALPVGGWSLGIEFAYYLLFPALLFAVQRRVARWALLLLLCALQAYWVATTAGSQAGYVASQVAYHQLPAFGAYFFAGCLIGEFQRHNPPTLSLAAGLLLWASMGALLWGLNPAQAGDELLGLRGVVLALACPLVVACSGWTRVPLRLWPVAGWLGDITYGTYLLHPALFFGVVWFVLPGLTDSPVSGLPQPLRWLLLVATLVVTALAAVASERWLERPLRRQGRHFLARPKAPGSGV